jgi:hypothetical protein
VPGRGWEGRGGGVGELVVVGLRVVQKSLMFYFFFHFIAKLCGKKCTLIESTFSSMEGSE